MKDTILKTIPRQHGTWFIFTTAYIMGQFIYSLPLNLSFLLFGGMFFLIFARNSMTLWVKELKKKKNGKSFLILALIYIAIASIPSLYLILTYHRYGLLIFAAVVGVVAIYSLYLSYTGKELSVTAEVVNIMVLSTVVPAIGYVKKGSFDLSTGAIWVATSLFYLGSIFRVRYLVRDRKILAEALPQRFRANINSLIYHTLSYLIIIFFSMNGLLPRLMIIAFLPTYIRAIYIIIRRYEKPPSVVRIGWSEVFNSVTFVILAIISYHGLRK